MHLGFISTNPMLVGHTGLLRDGRRQLALGPLKSPITGNVLSARKSVWSEEPPEELLHLMETSRPLLAPQKQGLSTPRAGTTPPVNAVIGVSAVWILLHHQYTL